MDQFLFKLKNPYTFYFVNHFPWGWPLCETLHFMGMALLIGTVAMLDLRMLGVGKGLPIAPLQRLIPYGVLGFIINLVTGIIFITAAPGNYASSWSLRWKMIFILVAGVNVLVFYGTGLARKVNALGPGDDAPGSAKLVAAISLFLWIGVMFWGRLLPFLFVGSGNPE